MKNLLLSSILSIFCLTISAQTKTWIGPAGGSYNVAANWSPSGIPGSNNDVVIPTGSSLTMDGATIKSFAIQGNSTVTLTSTVTFTDTSSISANASFNWSSGYIQGGGVLTNNGTFNFSAVGNKYLYGTTTLANQGTINFTTPLSFYIEDNSIVNNTTSGIIDFQTDAYIWYGASGSHILNNAGLIKMSNGANEAGIYVALNNTGTISVESGTLTLAYKDKTFNGGVYNVATGSELNWSANIMYLSGTLTGQLDGKLNWTNRASVASTATLNFSGNGFNWTGGYLQGDGVLTNNGTFNFSTVTNKYIYGTTTFANQGIINFSTPGSFYIEDNAIVNNTASGIIDFQADAYIWYDDAGKPILNNAGLIKKSNGPNEAGIYVALNNTGTISVESGTLNLGYQDKTLTGGIYNVAVGSELNWSANMILSGTLTGQLDGELNWIYYVSVPSTATLNFNGNGFNWFSGYLQDDGVLTNSGTINCSTTTNKYIYGTTTLANQGTINFTTPSTIYIEDNAIVNNSPSGIIDFQADAAVSNSGSNGTINNAGVIKKTDGTGVSIFSLPVTNTGIINALSGTMSFIDGNDFTNMADGIVMGTATIDVPAAANFINNGIFSPGGYPGILTVIGDFKSSPTSELQIELFGYTQGTEHDLLAVQGNAIIDGDIATALHFVPNVDDEFVVVTANSITSCNLPDSVTAHYDNYNYTFDVICNPDNVTLKVTTIVVGSEENKLSNLSMYPNPTNGNFAIDLGKEYPDITVRIYNMFGQVISSEKYTSARIIENHINIFPGIYFVNVSTSAGGSTSLRMIKQ